ncbi:MAG: diacylglycerol kinase family protein [Oscillospiraceae bacterium]|nr:diacylglycerol kinase family protein [Oscillospiraceae bacterium]
MRFFRSFYCAARGIFEAAKGRNFKIMLCIGALVIFFAARFYELSEMEWAVMFLTVGAVLSIEAVNTSVERLADKVCGEKDELIRKAKDCAAGGSLIISIFAVAIGVSLFWREEKFSEIISFFSEPLRIVILAAVLVLMVIFVIFPRRKKK